VPRAPRVSRILHHTGLLPLALTKGFKAETSGEVLTLTLGVRRGFVLAVSSPKNEMRTIKGDGVEAGKESE
jgi:hypothetical protein